MQELSKAIGVRPLRIYLVTRRVSEGSTGPSLTRRATSCLAPMVMCLFAASALAAEVEEEGAPKERFNPECRTFSSYKDVGYDQKQRPQFHFTSRKNWLNDPNGLVYYDGEWHLFFQHNPRRNGDGEKCWGHAVSKDLLHWEQLPHAILPYKSGSGKGGVIWSGSAVVDHNNSLGKQVGDVKTIVAFFTHTAGPMEQCAAYSTDKGRTFKLINEGDAVVPNQGIWKGERDPKVFWHDATKKWVMAVIVGGPDKLVRIWNSDDLVDWKEAGDFSRHFAECFDMYPLSVDGDRNNRKWVCNDAAFYYQIGDFNGSVFSSDNKMLLGDWGGRRFSKAFYAGQTFNNSPDGRVYQIAWMKGAGKDNPFKKAGLPFTQQMTFPCELTLRSTAEGVRIFRWPIDGIKTLYKKSHAFTNMTTVSEANEAVSDIKADLIDVSITFTPIADELITFRVRGLNITYGNSTKFPNKDGKMVTVPSIGFDNIEDAKPVIRIPAPTVDGVVGLRLLLDRLSIEMFVNGGAYAAASYCTPTTDRIEFSVSEGDALQVDSLVVNELRSIWKEDRR